MSARVMFLPIGMPRCVADSRSGKSGQGHPNKAERREEGGRHARRNNTALFSTKAREERELIDVDEGGRDKFDMCLAHLD